MSGKNLPIVDWLQIEASAPGKFIISGEYSVVYEKQAIASAIDLRTKVTIRPNKNGKVRVNLKNLQNIREWPTAHLTMCRLVTRYSECLDFDDTMPVQLNHFLHSKYYDTSVPPISNDPRIVRDAEKKADDAVMAFLLLYIGLGDSYSSSARPPIDVEIESTIPVGSGLGSSSALAVSLCGALMRVFRVVAEKYIISNWAFNIDKYFHGRPSGVDNSIITNGGFILFQNGKVKASGVSHKATIKVMLIDTGVSRSTKILSELVNSKLREDSTRINSIFNSINECTTAIWRKVNDSNFEPRSIAVNLVNNQEFLNMLGVGHEKLTDICSRAQRCNLVAKQTGAGGGGTAFVLYDELECSLVNRLKADLEEAGYRVHLHDVGCDGLLIKMTPDIVKQQSR